MTETSDPDWNETPAATLIVFRNARDGGPPELLMTRRSTEMRFVGGYVVFPGGKVDDADRKLAGEIASDAPPDHIAAQIAAIRETLEETGLLLGLACPVSLEEALEAREIVCSQGTLAAVLDRKRWQLDLDTIVPFARWCPPFRGGYDTRFFLADIGTGAVSLKEDATETDALFWASAREVLAMAERAEVDIIFPTRRNLERLAQFSSFSEAVADASKHPVEKIRPRTVKRDGEDWMELPENAGYPVRIARVDPVKPSVANEADQ